MKWQEGSHTQCYCHPLSECRSSTGNLPILWFYCKHTCLGVHQLLVDSHILFLNTCCFLLCCFFLYFFSHSSMLSVLSRPPPHPIFYFLFIKCAVLYAEEKILAMTKESWHERNTFIAHKVKYIPELSFIFSFSFFLSFITILFHWLDLQFIKSSKSLLKQYYETDILLLSLSLIFPSALKYIAFLFR